LLHRNLGEACPDAVPAPVLERLADKFRAGSVRCLRLTAELLRLQDAFAERDIRAAPYKGPALAAAAYGNIAMRQFADLDFLLAADDVFRARDLLVARGYGSAHGLTPEREAAHFKVSGEICLAQWEARRMVELHADPVRRYFGVPFDGAGLLARLRPVSLLGRATPTLCPEDLLLVLCAHAATHGWAGLGWVCDVAELLRAYPGLDAASMARQADSIHARRMLHLGLLLAQDLLDASVPELLRSVMSADVRSRRLAAGLGARIRRDRYRDGVRYCWTRTVLPSAADRAAAPRAPCLAFLCHVYRPFRLLHKHAIGPALRRLRSLARRNTG
jgi:hypothetical protein